MISPFDDFNPFVFRYRLKQSSTAVTMIIVFIECKLKTLIRGVLSQLGWNRRRIGTT